MAQSKVFPVRTLELAFSGAYIGEGFSIAREGQEGAWASVEIRGVPRADRALSRELAEHLRLCAAAWCQRHLEPSPAEVRAQIEAANEGRGEG